MAAAKNPVFIGLYLENCCLVGGSTFGWREKISWGESTGGGKEEIFGWWRLHPHRGKTLNSGGWGLRIWNFQRYQRNSIWIFQ